ncbi:hypothetical protein CUTA107171_24075 [Cupriavidus taiwanensis]
MEADAGLRAGGAFGLVVEDDQAMTGLGLVLPAGLFGAVLLMLEAIRQAFFRQQPRDKVKIGLAILAADRALAQRLAHRHAVLGQRIVSQHVFDDFQRGLVLVHIAIGARAQVIEPGPHRQPVARQATVAADGRAGLHIAVPGAAAAVGKHQPQRDFLGGQARGVQVCRRAQAIDVQLERCADTLLRDEALHYQVVGGKRRLQRDLARALAQQPGQGSHRG